MTLTDNDGQVVIGVPRVTGYILCVEKTGPDLFCQPRSQGLLKLAADRTSSVREVCSTLLCQSIEIDERFLCGYRLVID